MKVLENWKSDNVLFGQKPDWNLSSPHLLGPVSTYLEICYFPLYFTDTDPVHNTDSTSIDAININPTVAFSEHI